MGLIGLTALVTKHRIGVGKVDHDTLNTERTTGHGVTVATGQDRLKHRLGHLNVPGVVDLLGLTDGTGSRSSITTTLDLDLVEEDLVGVTEVGVALVEYRIARLELFELPRIGADRSQVSRLAGRVSAGSRTNTVPELSLLQDHAVLTHERDVRISIRCLPGDLESRIVDLLDGVDRIEVRLRRTGSRLVLAILPGEDDVVDAEVTAIRPLQARLDLPGDAHPISSHPTIRSGWDLSRNEGNQLIVLAVACQWLQDDGRTVKILGTSGEVRVERRDRLPVENGQLATSGRGGRSRCRSRGCRWRRGRRWCRGRRRSRGCCWCRGRCRLRCWRRRGSLGGGRTTCCQYQCEYCQEREPGPEPLLLHSSLLTAIFWV